MRKLVLFDIDGTLLNSDGAGRAAVHAALREHLGLPDDPPGIRFDGKTDPQIILELLAAAGRAADAGDPAVAAICLRYVTLLEQELQNGGHAVRLLPGVPLLLNAIEQEEALLGLLTGNLMDGARLKLGAAGLAFGRFRVGAFGSDHHDRAALPDIAADRAAPLMGRRPAGPDVVIIGDTPADMRCGKGIGARAIGVATGRYTAAELEGAGAWRVFEDLGDTAAVLEVLLA